DAFSDGELVLGRAAGARAGHGGKCAEIGEDAFAALHGKFGESRRREVRIDAAGVGNAEAFGVEMGSVAGVGGRCHAAMIAMPGSLFGSMAPPEFDPPADQGTMS